jgi:hypothetical protein
MACGFCVSGVRIVRPSVETRFGGTLPLAAAAAGFVSEILFGMSLPNPRNYFTEGEHMRWRHGSATTMAGRCMSPPHFARAVPATAVAQKTVSRKRRCRRCLLTAPKTQLLSL